MATGPRFHVALRRRREGRTDFRSRLGLLKSRQPRVVVRKSNNNFTVQFVTYDESGDQIVAAAQATDLRKLGWTGHTGNTTAAYLAGYLAGQRAKAAGVTAGVLDIGRQAPVPKSRVFAGLKGALDAGIEIPHGESIFPEEDRLSGSIKGDELAKLFEDVKAKISKNGGASE